MTALPPHDMPGDTHYDTPRDTGFQPVFNPCKRSAMPENL
jgi:hypothetical protein